jgi:hypothetical protein
MPTPYLDYYGQEILPYGARRRPRGPMVPMVPAAPAPVPMAPPMAPQPPSAPTLPGRSRPMSPQFANSATGQARLAGQPTRQDRRADLFTKARAQGLDDMTARRYAQVESGSAATPPPMMIPNLQAGTSGKAGDALDRAKAMAGAAMEVPTTTGADGTMTMGGRKSVFSEQEIRSAFQGAAANGQAGPPMIPYQPEQRIDPSLYQGPKPSQATGKIQLTEQQAREMWRSSNQAYGADGAEADFLAKMDKYGQDGKALLGQWRELGMINQFDFQQPGDRPQPVPQTPVAIVDRDPRAGTGGIYETARGRVVTDPNGRMMGTPLAPPLERFTNPPMQMPAPNGPQPGYTPLIPAGNDQPPAVAPQPAPTSQPVAQAPATQPAQPVAQAVPGRPVTQFEAGFPRGPMGGRLMSGPTRGAAPAQAQGAVAQQPAPASQPVAQGGPVRVNTPQEAAALPPGTRFVTPDGQIRTRK